MLALGRIVDQERLDRREEQALRIAGARQLAAGIARVAAQFLEDQLAPGGSSPRSSARSSSAASKRSRLRRQLAQILTQFLVGHRFGHAPHLSLGLPLGRTSKRALRTRLGTSCRPLIRRGAFSRPAPRFRPDCGRRSRGRSAGGRRCRWCGCSRGSGRRGSRSRRPERRCRNGRTAPSPADRLARLSLLERLHLGRIGALAVALVEAGAEPVAEHAGRRDLAGRAPVGRIRNRTGLLRTRRRRRRRQAPGPVKLPAMGFDPGMRSLRVPTNRRPTWAGRRDPVVACRLGEAKHGLVNLRRRNTGAARFPGMRSRRRQHQLGPQAADRGGAERQRAAIERREIDHDRQAEAGAGLGLVEPVAAPRLPPARAPTAVRPGPSSSTTTRSVVPRLRAVGALRQHLDGDARLRPLAGIVDQVADHLLEVLPLAAEARLARRLDVDRDAAVAVDLLHACARAR